MVNIDFPNSISLSKKEAKLLEDLLHNSVETILRPYFRVSKNEKEYKLEKPSGE